MEALHRAEKAKQQNYLLAVATGNRKGGIPTKQLRGINEADFFQKNNSDERGFTFNYDGTLVDFKKPHNNRTLIGEVEYDTTGQASVNKNMKGGKGKHFSNPSDHRSSQNYLKSNKVNTD